MRWMIRGCEFFFLLIWKEGGGGRGGCIIHHVSYQEGYKQISAGVFLVQVVSQLKE